MADARTWQRLNMKDYAAEMSANASAFVLALHEGKNLSGLDGETLFNYGRVGLARCYLLFTVCPISQVTWPLQPVLHAPWTILSTLVMVERSCDAMLNVAFL